MTTNHLPPLRRSRRETQAQFATRLFADLSFAGFSLQVTREQAQGIAADYGVEAFARGARTVNLSTLALRIAKEKPYVRPAHSDIYFD